MPVTETEDLYALNKKDVEVLKDIVKRFPKGPSQTLLDRGNNNIDERIQYAPQVYIAFPKEADGIPGLKRNENDDFDDPQLDKPGVAVCDIYQIVYPAPDDEAIQKQVFQPGVFGNRVFQPGALAGPTNGESIPELHLMGHSEQVFNLHIDARPQDWLIVGRDYYGRWVVLDGPSYLLGVLTSSLSAYGTATANEVRYDADDGFINSGREVDIRNFLGWNVPTNARIICVPYGAFYIPIAADCGATTGTG